MRRNLNVCVLSSHSPNVLHLTDRNSTRLLPDTLGKLNFCALSFALITSCQRFLPSLPPRPFFLGGRAGTSRLRTRSRCSTFIQIQVDRRLRLRLERPPDKSELFARPIPSARPTTAATKAIQSAATKSDPTRQQSTPSATTDDLRKCFSIQQLVFFLFEVFSLGSRQSPRPRIRARSAASVPDCILHRQPLSTAPTYGLRPASSPSTAT
jgi:hypothetical protein